MRAAKFSLLEVLLGYFAVRKKRLLKLTLPIYRLSSFSGVSPCR